MKKSNKKIKEIRITKWQAFLIVLALFLLIFLFNISRINKPANYSDSTVNKNVEKVNKVQNASVAVIERAVDKLDQAATNGTGTDSRKLRYIRKFKNSLVIGDSLTEGLSVYGFLSSSQVFSKIGASVLTCDDLFAKAASSYPKNAFFAFGMNDMGNYAGDEKAFTKRYAEEIRKFKKKSPDTKIYVCSISAPTAEAIKGNKSIGNYVKFNKAIKSMCKKEKVTYIDITDILQKKPNLYEGDGIHASPAYYPIWLDRMAVEAGI